MTESQENEAITVNPIGPPHGGRPSRLYQSLASVGIVAGSLFIVATVFFSGYVLGKQSERGAHHGPQRMLLTPFHKGMQPPGQMQPGEGPRSARLTPPSVSSIPPSP